MSRYFWCKIIKLWNNYRMQMTKINIVRCGSPPVLAFVGNVGFGQLLQSRCQFCLRFQEMAIDKALKHQLRRRDGEGLNFEGHCSEWAYLSQGGS